MFVFLLLGSLPFPTQIRLLLGSRHALCYPGLTAMLVVGFGGLVEFPPSFSAVTLCSYMGILAVCHQYGVL